MTIVFRREIEGDLHSQRHRGQSPVNQTETRRMLPRAKECQEPPGLNGTRELCLLGTSEGPTLDVGLPPSSTVREKATKFVVICFLRKLVHPGSANYGLSSNPSHCSFQIALLIYLRIIYSTFKLQGRSRVVAAETKRP